MFRARRHRAGHCFLVPQFFVGRLHPFPPLRLPGGRCGATRAPQKRCSERSSRTDRKRLSRLFHEESRETALPCEDLPCRVLGTLLAFANRRLAPTSAATFFRPPPAGQAWIVASPLSPCAGFRVSRAQGAMGAALPGICCGSLDRPPRLRFFDAQRLPVRARSER